MKSVSDIGAMREIIGGWRQDRESVALVPTMGNLHAGHMSLVRLAQEHAERVVVSIFVNPTQFGPGEDFESYPRTLQTDRRRLSRAGVDILLLPTREQIYPFGEPAATHVSVPGLSTILCGASRPGHFDGVTSVVCRLFNIVQPDVAVFGQKDYQQLVIIRRLVADLHLPLTILAGPTYRERDGLAMSSRNQYLDEAQRARATGIYRALTAGCERLQAGDRSFADVEAEGLAALRAAGFEPDYFAVRRAGDLAPPDRSSRYLVVLAAGRLGRARLIDNLLVELPAD